MEYGPENNIFVLKMMMKSGLVESSEYPLSHVNLYVLLFLTESSDGIIN